MGDAPGRRPGAPSSPGVRVLGALVSLFLLAGCKVDVAVDVKADTTGGGHVRASVTLDRDAAAQVPDLAEQLRVDDLEDAGWKVDDPSPTAAGVTLRATKSFSSSAGAVLALQELSGSGGPFGTLRVSQERTFWKTKTTLGGVVDLTSGLDVFGDDALRQRLGPGLGVDPASVERELGRPLADAFTFELAALLPGDVESNAPGGDRGSAVWPVRLGQTIPVTASSEAWNVFNIAVAAISLAAALSLVVVLVRRSRSVSWG